MPHENRTWALSYTERGLTWGGVPPLRWIVTIREYGDYWNRCYIVWRTTEDLEHYEPREMRFSTLHQARQWACRLVDIAWRGYDVEDRSTWCRKEWFALNGCSELEEECTT